MYGKFWSEYVKIKDYYKTCVDEIVMLKFVLNKVIGGVYLNQDRN
jgi:hypothetical protein